MIIRLVFVCRTGGRTFHLIPNIINVVDVCILVEYVWMNEPNLFNIFGEMPFGTIPKVSYRAFYSRSIFLAKHDDYHIHSNFLFISLHTCIS